MLCVLYHKLFLRENKTKTITRRSLEGGDKQDTLLGTLGVSIFSIPQTSTKKTQDKEATSAQLTHQKEHSGLFIFPSSLYFETL